MGATNRTLGSMLFTALLCPLGLLGQSPSPAPSEPVVAIVGATLVDPLVEAGDIDDSVVLLRGGEVWKVGQRGSVDIPADAEFIAADDRYLVPGLIDVFAAHNDQRYCDAYLHSGVTTVVAVSGGRRGDFFTLGGPSPDLKRLESVGSEGKPLTEELAEVDRLAAEGVDVLLLMYELKLGELEVLSTRAREHGMATIGELGRTRYRDSASAQIDAFVHTTRYSLDIAPEDMRRAVADEPFSDDLQSPKWLYYLWLASLDAGDAGVQEHARALKATGAALIPTISLLYLDMPWSKNPWELAVASILQPESIHRPADHVTGKHTDDAPHMDAYARVAQAVMRIEKQNVAAGVPHLAGSGTDVWGSMPGISLHTELEGLERAGLTPREVLSAATNGPATTFGWSDRGRIEPGRRADLLLLRDDPRLAVQNLQSIERLWLAGDELDRAALLGRERDMDGEIVGQTVLRLPSSHFEERDGRTQLTADSAYLADVELSEVTYLSDGLRVRAMVAVPRGPGPYPCMVYCRGGNREFGAIQATSVSGFLATVASWGYVVVAPQYRGNGGGEGLEEFGGADVNDVLNAAAMLDHIGKADSSRVGIYGGSRGGMMGLLAMRGSTRFSAAIFRCGLTDLVAWKQERPGIDTVYQELIPGYSADDNATLIARSAAYWVDELPATTPILWMHGTADWRVSPASALRFATRLQEAHIPYRLVMFEGADHSLTGFTGERNRLTREWLDRYVRDEQEPPSMDPHGD